MKIFGKFLFWLAFVTMVLCGRSTSCSNQPNNEKRKSALLFFLNAFDLFGSHINRQPVFTLEYPTNAKTWNCWVAKWMVVQRSTLNAYNLFKQIFNTINYLFEENVRSATCPAFFSLSNARFPTFVQPTDFGRMKNVCCVNSFGHFKRNYPILIRRIPWIFVSFTRIQDIGHNVRISLFLFVYFFFFRKIAHHKMDNM